MIKDSFKVENEVENRKNINSVKQDISIDREGIFNLNHRLNIELLEHSQRLIENNQVLLKQQDKEKSIFSFFKKVSPGDINKK